MESASNTISGDLPIRLSRQEQQLIPVEEAEEVSESTQTQDMKAQPMPKPVIDAKSLEDEAARQIDVSTILPENKKRANKKPKSKRGRVVTPAFQDF